MKVILLADVKGVGKKGQEINASDGYARNFLIPKKLGMEINASNLNDIKLKKQAEEQKRAEELEAAQKLKELLESKEVKVSVKTGENGKLFGSVTNKEIAQAIEEVCNVKIDKKKVVLDEQIKMVGSRTVPVKLHQKVTAEVKVIIAEA